jgi:hypothetical protein
VTGVLALFLAVVFFSIDLPKWSELQREKLKYRTAIKDFFNKKYPDLYSFAFVLMCFVGFSLWESLIYYLLKKDFYEVARAVGGSGLFLCAIVLKARFNRIGTMNFWVFSGWVVLLGSWISGILFAPWLLFRWKRYQKTLV